MSGPVEVRPARRADEAALAAIDHATWTRRSSPSPPPAGPAAFFGERTHHGDVLVADLDGRVAGYVKLGAASPLASHRHVLQVQGLAVDPALQRRGIARALVAAAAAEARRRGARRLTLRVLGDNRAAFALYASCGFHVEGVLREEFLLDGRYVDDVLMARALV